MNRLILIALILLCFVLVIFNLPFDLGYKMLVVSSGSMEPQIKTGSVILIKKQSNYKLDDIITFKISSKKEIMPTTHRIVDRRIQDDKELYITKGDANQEKDWQEIKQEDVWGLVVVVIPYVGYVVNFLSQGKVFFFLLFLLLLMIVFDFSSKRYKKNKKV